MANLVILIMEGDESVLSNYYGDDNYIIKAKAEKMQAPPNMLFGDFS